MKKILIVALLILFITTTASSAGAVEFGSNSANINHTYMSTQNGNLSALFYTGYGNYSLQYEYTHIVGTDTVDGVKCVRVISLRTEFSEFTESWVAQDISGNIYFLKYWDGEDLTPVVLGKDNAELLMPKNPKVGDKIFGDKTIVEIGVTVPQLSTGLGPFANCLKAIETDGDICYYAPNFGQVKKEYSDQSGWELKEIFYTKSRVVVIPLSD
jgi:hypothetical protein